MFDFATQKQILQPILKHPSNYICADCDTRSPTWASLDFGVFLCPNCSGAHRALGPTITRVKSANLDLWQEQWVENMVLGNEQINAYWESEPSFKSKKPKMGATPDDIRKYVYDKYVKKKYVENPSEDDPLRAYKNQTVPQQIQQKQKKIKQPQPNKQTKPNANVSKQLQSPKIETNTNIPKKELSLLDFDLQPAPVQTTINTNANGVQNHEQQFTSYTECGTSFTNETSKDSFIDFNTLMQSHRQGQTQMHHSLSTQAVFQHSGLYNNNQQYYNAPSYNHVNTTQFHQNYAPFTHQNYFQHPYPTQNHYSPAQVSSNHNAANGQGNVRNLLG